jgi:uncharacterized protein YjbJ (UPF0337 family)
MSSTTDKIEGAANQAMGKVKEGAGKVLGNEQMQGEGLAQQAKGAAQKAVGDAKDAVKNTVDKV